MLNRKKKNITIFFVVVLNFLITFITMFSLKSRLPLNIFKEVPNNMVPRERLLVIPAIIVALGIAQIFYRLKTMDLPVTTGKRIEDAAFSAVTGILMLIGWIFVYIGYEFTLNPVLEIKLPILSIVLFILATAITSIASTLPINEFGSRIGLRTKETLEDENVWRLANRFNAFTMFLSSIVLLILAIYFALNTFKWSYLAMAIVFDLIITFYAPRLYAKLVSSKMKNREKFVM